MLQSVHFGQLQEDVVTNIMAELGFPYRFECASQGGSLTNSPSNMYISNDPGAICVSSETLDRDCFLRLGAGTLRGVGVSDKLAADLGLLANGMQFLYLYHYHY